MTSIAGKHVAVLMGGLSPEREVSLVSGAPVQAMERLMSHTTMARRLVSSSNCLT